MKKKILFAILIVIIAVSVIAGTVHFVSEYNERSEQRELKQQQQQKVEQLIDSRRDVQLKGEKEDPFGDDDVVRVLLIGLDSRAGQEFGHCDAIQMFEVNRANNTIRITAVPRGTYAPLPGTGHLATDYYVSKACEVGGLEYGVEQIEKILGRKADYVVMVGFSEAMGVFRFLKLPATETLQWLRHRQGYAVGEPQRARNHSNFLKQMLIKYIPNEEKTIDNIEDSLRDMVLPLINLDKNMIPEHILIPQEKVKKITKKDVDKIDFKKIFNEETEEEDD